MCSDVWDAKHTLRELRLMRLMEHHPNVISLRDLTLVEAADELYIVMELMDADLHKIITSKQALSKPHMQVIVSQILRGVNALHDNDVFHRDLKPGNILVGRDCQIRITDFGLARSLPPSTANSATALDAEETPSAMTEYVVTRWYRCPELLLAPHCAYTSAVDLWSVGCIVAEMVGRAPLFPGRSYVHQVQLILDAIGTPPSDAEMGFEPRADARAYLSRQQAKPGRPWPALLPGADPEVLDLIGCLLVFNPKKRQTAKEAMEVSKSGERRERRAKCASATKNWLRRRPFLLCERGEGPARPKPRPAPAFASAAAKALLHLSLAARSLKTKRPPRPVPALAGEAKASASVSALR